MVTDTQWRLFCDQFGLEALATDATLDTQEARRAARDRVIPIVAEALRGYTKAELMGKCETLGLPFAPIAQPWDLFDDPHLTQSGGLAIVTLADGRSVALPAYPLALDGERLALRRDLPAVGEHNDEILAELGLADVVVAHATSPVAGRRSR